MNGSVGYLVNSPTRSQLVAKPLLGDIISDLSAFYKRGSLLILSRCARQTSAVSVCERRASSGFSETKSACWYTGLAKTQRVQGQRGYPGADPGPSRLVSFEESRTQKDTAGREKYFAIRGYFMHPFSSRASFVPGSFLLPILKKRRDDQ